MEIRGRNRNGGFGRTVSFSEEKVKYNLDLCILDTMVSYVLSANRNIKKGNLINMRNFFEVLDLEIYKQDIEKIKRINLIKKGLEARLVKDLKKPSLILAYITGGHSGMYSLEDFPEIDNAEMEFINDTVCNGLKAAFCEKRMDRFHELYTRYKALDIKDRYSMTPEVETFIADWHNDFRRAKSEDTIITKFSLEDGVFENTVSDIYDIVTSGSRFLYSGCQGINAIVGGGFEATRFYLFAGTAAAGKSMFLLNLAKQFKKWNKGFQTKDPTKKPTIVYLTQENSVEETIERLFAMISSGGQFKNYTKKEVIEILKNEGELFLSDENNINISIIYKPNRSIDTGDLYSIVEDLEDDGYECIALLQDHIKRIRAVEKSTDLRIELGNVVNEMKVFAQLKQIPVISVTHLNRDASSKLEAGAAGNKTDLTRMLGRSNVGESMLMIDNADFAYILNKDFDHEQKAYMVLWCIKHRGFVSTEYICQPYEENNETNILEDYDGVPLFKDTLQDPNRISNMAQSMKKNNVKPSNYNMSSLSLDEDDDDDLGSFLSGSNYKPIDAPTYGTLGERVVVKKSEEEQKEVIQPISQGTPLFSIYIPNNGPSCLQSQSLIDFF